MAEWFETYKKPLYSFLYHMVPSAADDLLQEVFVRALKGLERYEERQKASSWLFTIANRLALDHLRSRPVRQSSSLDAEAPSGASVADVLRDPLPGPESELEGLELKARIDAALASLPAPQRQVFLMREYSGLSFKEIAGILGIPLNTALGRMHYAVTRLRETLRPARVPPR